MQRRLQEEHEASETTLYGVGCVDSAQPMWLLRRVYLSPSCKRPRLSRVLDKQRGFVNGAFYWTISALLQGHLLFLTGTARFRPPSAKVNYRKINHLFCPMSAIWLLSPMRTLWTLRSAWSLYPASLAAAKQKPSFARLCMLPDVPAKFPYSATRASW